MWIPQNESLLNDSSFTKAEIHCMALFFTKMRFKYVEVRTAFILKDSLRSYMDSMVGVINMMKIVVNMRMAPSTNWQMASPLYNQILNGNSTLSKQSFLYKRLSMRFWLHSFRVHVSFFGTPFFFSHLQWLCT